MVHFPGVPGKRYAALRPAAPGATRRRQRPVLRPAGVSPRVHCADKRLLRLAFESGGRTEGECQGLSQRGQSRACRQLRCHSCCVSQISRPCCRTEGKAARLQVNILLVGFFGAKKTRFGLLAPLSLFLLCGDLRLKILRPPRRTLQPLLAATAIGRIDA